jgi:peptidoglycan/LPS O-acetylase OafA/YrhL
VQVYLAGLFLMGGGGEDARMMHVGLGRMLQFYPVLPLIAGLFAQLPRRFWAMFVALWIAVIVQAWLPLLSATDGAGWVRAVHPLNGFFLIGISVQLTRFAWGLAAYAKRGAAPAGTEG